MLLKECDQVEQAEEIAFIFVVMIDYSVKPAVVVVEQLPVPGGVDKVASQSS